MKETLTCSSCSKKWKRELVRGRKPVVCPKCSASTITSPPPKRAVQVVATPVKRKKRNKKEIPLQLEATSANRSSDGQISTGDVYAMYHPRHPKADELLEQTRGGSVWQCTFCKHKIKIFLPLSAPPTHKCSDNGKSKPCERIS